MTDVSDHPTDEGLQAIAEQAVARMWEADHASQAMGMEVGQVNPGRAVVTMRVRDDMVNGHGICHGGHIFTLADSSFAFACNSHGPTTVAQAADITFLAPARRGDLLQAVAVERWRKGRNGITDVTVTRTNDGEAIAEFRGRSRTVGDALR